MKTPSLIKNALYSWVVFFGTVILLSVGYAAYSLATETSGSQLTADKWNAVINWVNDLDSRVAGVASSISALQVSGWNLWNTSGGNISYTGGNVGIGTSTPGSSFHVYRDTWDNAEIAIQSNAGALKHWAIYNDRGSNSLRFWNNDISGEKNILTLLNNGNVGIGTVSPNSNLSFGANNSTVYFYDSGTSGWRYGLGIRASELQFFIPSGGTHFSFNTGGDKQTSGTNELVRIGADGNVGIGTIAPTQKLEVAGTVKATSFVGDGSGLTGVGGGVPTGAVMAFYGSICPNGWAAADGATTVKKTDGTNSTLDLRGQFVRGLNASASGLDANRALASTQTSQNLAHTHAAGTLATASAGAHTHTVAGFSNSSGYTAFGSAVNNGPLQTTSSAWAHTHTITGNTAADSANTEARPNNIALLYCVKN